MNRFTRSILAAVALLLVANAAMAQKVGDLGDKLGLDPAVRTGKLPNGLTYFIRRNAKPEKRLELRLAVNAGSVLERDDQQGLAHFVEHMAFNGTKNFHKHDLINFLESIGMRFGADLNAYTSFDETVYMLQLPAEDPKVIDKGMQILEDWAHNVLMEDKEIDDERGVIMEEWRLSRGAGARMRDKTFPVMFQGSSYGVRVPIGLPEVIQNFKHDVLREFYRDWYRPDLMAVIVVGDYDPDKIEAIIKKHFGSIPAAKNAPARPKVAIPDNKGTLFVAVTDPEARGSDVNVYFKHDPVSHVTVGDYRNSLIEQMAASMVNDRLNEIARSANPPFLNARAGVWEFNNAKRMMSLTVTVEDNGHLRGFEAALTELERARRHGFTQGELDRAIADLLTNYESYYNERDKTESGNYCRELVSYFLGRESAPGIAYEYAMVQKYIPKVTLDDVNRAFAPLITDENRVVTMSAPEKEGVTVPTEAQTMSVFAKVAGSQIAAYVDKTNDKPLLPKMPVAGKVVGEKTLADISVVEWTLSNGVHVVLKPTDFKNDEILMSAFSPGGLSLVSDADLVPASTAAGIVAQSGVGEFTLVDLGKALSGKDVRVSPVINELTEGFSGSSTPKDLETMMQLIYLYSTAPRRDETAFNVMKQQLTAAAKNRAADPQQVFVDSVRAALAGNSPRRRFLDQAYVDQLNLDRALAVYKDRFADMGDFTFVFVGNFVLSDMRRLCEQYLAALPSSRRQETWKDWNMSTLRGNVTREIQKGLDPKSTVVLDYNGTFEYNRENRFYINMICDILDIRLRESLREESGGVYSVSAYPNMGRIPTPTYDIFINFGCAPDRVSDMINKAMAVVEKFKKEGPNAEELGKAKEIHLRERETRLKENSFWLGALQSRYLNQEDPTTIPQEDRLVQAVTAKDLQTAAERFFTGENLLRIIQNPEPKSGM